MRGASGLVSRDTLVAAVALSEKRAAKASPPKPFAQRAIISRREIGGAIKRLQ